MKNGEEKESSFMVGISIYITNYFACDVHTSQQLC